MLLKRNLRHKRIALAQIMKSQPGQHITMYMDIHVSSGNKHGNYFNLLNHHFDPAKEKPQKMVKFQGAIFLVAGVGFEPTTFRL